MWCNEKKACIIDLLGKVEGKRFAESRSRLRNPGDSDEVQTGSEDEFSEEVFCQPNKLICKTALSEFEYSGIRKFLTEERIIARSFDSCWQDEYFGTENDHTLSPDCDELSNDSRMMTKWLKILRTHFFWM